MKHTEESQKQINENKMLAQLKRCNDTECVELAEQIAQGKLDGTNVSELEYKLDYLIKDMHRQTRIFTDRHGFINKIKE